MKFFKDYGLYLLGFLIIGGVLVLVVTMNTDEPEADLETSADSSNADVLEETRPADTVTTPSNIEETTLTAVGNYSGDGEATRSFDANTPLFLHEVVANLDDPREGKFYEGWLVDGEAFISTGKLSSELVGVWSLSFSSEEDLRNYSNIVITEETEADGLDNRPEDHVLEGSF